MGHPPERDEKDALQPDMKGPMFVFMKAKATARNRASRPQAHQQPAEPRVVAAPGMLDRKLVVNRQQGESDARYEDRRDLFDILLQSARRSSQAT